MKHYLQKRIGISVSVAAFILACIQYFVALSVYGKGLVYSFLEPSVLFVFITGIIILIMGLIKSRASRIVQVAVALLTGYGTSLSATSGDLTYLIFLVMGCGIALEYGFFDKQAGLKGLLILGLLLSTLVYGMIFLNHLSVLVIVHSLLGAAIVVYIFYLLLRVRVNRYNAETQRLEEMVAERTKGLREEMERTRELQGDLQITLAEKNHLLKEKDVLLKEVLHRTKNNMQLISSFISLERDNLEDSKTDNALEKSMNRINTLALAHELLYRSENLNVINLKVYVERLVREIWSDLFDSNVLLETTIPRDIPTNLDFAIPLGLMLNEFITNAFRYAFPDHREGVVSIDIRLKDQTLVLLFRDNGVGMPSTVDPQSPDTLGLQLVSELLQQNGGTYILRRDEGTEWEIQIPFTTDRA